MIIYKGHLLKIAACLCGICVVAVTLFIFGYVLYHGFASISWSFIFDKPAGIPLGTEGGVFPAIMGTLYLGALSGLMAGLVGSLTAVFVVFYCRHSWLKGIINGAIYFLSGMPSILFGLVGYTMLIHKLGLPRSLLAAGITVAVMILPFITIRIIKIFREDIMEMLHASLCLGLSKAYIIRKLVLPNYFIEILTSITLGMAYGVGAAAPVMFTGAVIYAETPTSISQPFMTLSYHLYILVNDGISLENAYGSAFILLLLLLIINIICRALERLREGAEWNFGRSKR